MRVEHLPLLACPVCAGALALEDPVFEKGGAQVEEGNLRCAACGTTYPLIRGVPRFVDESHYSSSFGFEWQRHATTQFDSVSGQGASRKRLFRESKWPERMEGEVILEAGCGSGRFTEQLLTTGATVLSADASIAVDENYRRHKEHPNSCIVQADLLALPVHTGSADRVLCIGVLQHTPDPFRSLEALVSYLKAGGRLAADIYDKPPFYRRMWNTRYWARPLTTRLSPEKLYALVSAYVHFMWPLVLVVHRLPYGVKINHKLLVAEHLSYAHLSPLSQREWAILDTFDWLSPKYELPQTLSTMKRWCAALPLREAEVTYGYGGIEVRAVKA